MMSNWRKMMGAMSRPSGGTEWFAILPPAALFVNWLGGQQALAVFAAMTSLLALYLFRLRKTPTADNKPLGFGSEAEAERFLDQAMSRGAAGDAVFGYITLAFDDPQRLFQGHRPSERAEIERKTAERLADTTRQGDIVVLFANSSFAVCLGQVRRMDLETIVQIAARLQHVAILPLSVAGKVVHPSVSIGVCLSSRAPGPTGRHLMDAGRAALDEALRQGPGAIRVFQPEMMRRHHDRNALRADLETALDSGQIRPWFQPQVCADQGHITGIEALARWHHPDRGIIPPSDFLPLVEEAGLSPRLSEVILYGALSALSRWDKAGFAIPSVSVNFCAAELAVPKLDERLKWELDRFDLEPRRLTLEVLESVAGRDGNDIVGLNLSRIAALGCGIDLDDFGTGQAAIANLRRFSIRRVKIDRSFVARVDTDQEQKRLVSAILGLCENLGLESVAEGVETPAEHATLAQLGCHHLQGFGIARPMAMEETFGWIERHNRGIQNVSQQRRVFR